RQVGTSPTLRGQTSTILSDHLNSQMTDNSMSQVPFDPDQVAGDALPRSANRKCVIVLSMHRSGTSAVAGTLGLLGATLPEDLVAVRPTNPKGHFESNGVLAVNEQMLQATGSAWYDFRHITCANLEPALAAEFKSRLLDALQRSYGESALFVLKDPRLC